MDGLSAVSSISSIIQLFQFSARALGQLDEIRKSAFSATRRNSELEETARSVLTKCRTMSELPESRASGTLQELGRKCSEAARDLVQVLVQIRSKSKLASTYHAMRKDKTIEELEQALSKRLQEMHQFLQRDSWSDLKALANKQTENFLILRREQDVIRHRIDFLQMQQTNVTRSIHSSLREMRMERFHRRFLHSLSYTEIDARRRNITTPARDSLEWLYPKFNPISIRLGLHSVRSDPFEPWLRSGRQLYWVSGKARSGKSTLMSHVVDDERTKQALQLWSRDRQLHILSFYFWRTGPLLQRSTTGLLRSSLYQLCQAQPIAVHHLLETFSINPQMLPVWNDKMLLSAITTIIVSLNNASFCFFVDGLDECISDFDELCDVFDHLQSLKNVKCSLSSRPKMEFIKRFAGGNQMYLQEMNWNGIFDSVSRKLGLAGIKDCVELQLAQEVAQRAEGMFVWASLLTESLVRGSNAGDEKAMLFKRIRNAPPLEGVFEEMIGAVHDGDREILAFYLSCMKILGVLSYGEHFTSDEAPLWPILSSVGVLTCARMEDRIVSYEAFEKECRRTETQIAAYSAGLLEVRSGCVYDGGFDKSLASAWTSTSQRFLICGEEHQAANISVQRNKQDLHNPTLRRRERDYTASYPDILEYECRRIHWVHRSAFEFITRASASNLLNYCRLSHAEVRRAMWQGALKYLTTAPSCRIAHSEGPHPRFYSFDSPVVHPYYTSTITYARLEEMIVYAKRTYQNEPGEALVMMDELRTIVQKMDAVEFTCRWEQPYPGGDHGKSSGSLAIWIQCTVSGFWEYIDYRIEEMVNEPADLHFFAQLLATTVLNSDSHLDRALHTIRALLDRICDHSSSADLFLRPLSLFIRPYICSYPLLMRRQCSYRIDHRHVALKADSKVGRDMYLAAAGFHWPYYIANCVSQLSGNAQAVLTTRAGECLMQFAELMGKMRTHFGIRFKQISTWRLPPLALAFPAHIWFQMVHWFYHDVDEPYTIRDWTKFGELVAPDLHIACFASTTDSTKHRWRAMHEAEVDVVIFHPRPATMEMLLSLLVVKAQRESLDSQHDLFCELQEPREAIQTPCDLSRRPAVDMRIKVQTLRDNLVPDISANEGSMYPHEQTCAFAAINGYLTHLAASYPCNHTHHESFRNGMDEPHTARETCDLCEARDKDSFSPTDTEIVNSVRRKIRCLFSNQLDQ